METSKPPLTHQRYTDALARVEQWLSTAGVPAQLEIGIIRQYVQERIDGFNELAALRDEIVELFDNAIARHV